MEIRKMRTHETCMHDPRDPRALVGWRFTPRNRSDSALARASAHSPHTPNTLLHDKSRHLWSWTRLSARYALSRLALGSFAVWTRTMNVRPSLFSVQLS